MIFCGSPEGSTDSGSGFKASQKTGQRLKVSSDRLGFIQYVVSTPTFPKIQTVVCCRVAWLYQYWPGGFMILWLYVQELPKAQPEVVLVLKRLRRRGNSLKSHPTDWEKPGIEPATPGLQDIGLSPTPRRLHAKIQTVSFDLTFL